MFRIETRHVPAKRVMSIQRRLHAPETDGFVREARRTFARHLAGAEPAGPLMLIFHGVVSEDSDGPLEVVLGCAGDVGPTDIIGIRPSPPTTRRTQPLRKPSGPTRPSWPRTTRWPALPRSPPGWEPVVVSRGLSRRPGGDRGGPGRLRCGVPARRPVTRN